MHLTVLHNPEEKNYLNRMELFYWMEFVQHVAATFMTGGAFSSERDE